MTLTKRILSALLAAVMTVGMLPATALAAEPTVAETSQVPTETELPTEVPTETPTEVPTEAPTEAPTEVPTEVPSEAPAPILTEDQIRALLGRDDGTWLFPAEERFYDSVRSHCGALPGEPCLFCGEVQETCPLLMTPVGQWGLEILTEQGSSVYAPAEGILHILEEDRVALEHPATPEGLRYYSILGGLETVAHPDGTRLSGGERVGTATDTLTFAMLVSKEALDLDQPFELGWALGESGMLCNNPEQGSVTYTFDPEQVTLKTAESPEAAIPQGSTDSIPQTSVSQEGDTVSPMALPTSGSCGPNLTFQVTGDVLTISGTGPMNDGRPWSKYITKAVIGPGVTTIGKKSFYECTLTEVVLPEGLTEIRDQAFRWCTDMTTITIPNTVTTIGEGAFEECRAMQISTLPEKLTYLGPRAFGGCDGIMRMTLPDSLKALKAGTFQYCHNLEEFHTGNGVVDVDWSALDYSDRLKRLVIGDSVTSLADNAFNGRGLESVVIGSSVERIGSKVFERCSRLTEVTLKEGLRSIGYRAFFDCDTLPAIRIPASVGEIGADAFWSCNLLAEVTIGGSSETPLSIGSAAFSNCAIQKLTLGQNVAAIGPKAFRYNNALGPVTIPDSVSIIGEDAFADCGITDLTIGNGVTSLDWSAFRNCRELTSVIIGDKVPDIAENAFAYCRKLHTVVVGDSVASIGAGAFSECSALRDVTLGSGLVELGYRAFYKCEKLPSLILPDGLATIGGGAFSSNTSLAALDIPDTVTSIGTQCFYYCENLAKIDLGRNLTTLGEEAFAYCAKLERIDLPDSLRALKQSTFVGCTALREVIIGDGVREVYWSSFSQCSALERLVIGNSVPEIGSQAFMHYYPNLREVIIGDSVTEIGDSAFFGCKSLGHVVMGCNVKIIRGSAFANCNAMTEIILPDSLRSIGQHAFLHTGLDRITLGSGLKSVNFDAFQRAIDRGGKLSQVNYCGTPEEFKAIWFDSYNDALLDAPITYNCVNPIVPGDIRQEKLKDVHVVVQGNQKAVTDQTEKYTLLSGVRITTGDGQTVTTDDQGAACLHDPQGVVEFTKDGYIPRKISSVRLKDYCTVNLQKDTDAPVINGLWFGDKDVLQQSAKVLPVGEKTYEITPEISWGPNKMVSIKLIQKGKSVPLVEGVNRLELGSMLDLTEEIRIVATNDKGRTTERAFRLIFNSRVQDLSVNLGNQLSFTLPDSLGPVLGGSEFNIGFPARIPAKLVVENGKFHAAIGLANHATDETVVKDYTTLVKNMKEQLEETGNSLERYKAMKDFLAEMKDKKGLKCTAAECAFGTKGSLTLAGYIDGVIDAKGNLQITESGGMMMLYGSWEGAKPFIAFGFPMLVEFGVEGQGEGRLTLPVDWNTLEIRPKVKILGNLTGYAGLGVGIPKLITASGGGEIGLDTDTRIEECAIRYFTLDGFCNFYAKLQILTFENKIRSDVARKRFVEYPKPAEVSLEAAGGETMDLFDPSAYRRMDLSYLDRGSDFMGLSQARAFRAEDQRNGPAFVENVYSGAEPKTVTFADGTRLALWVNRTPGTSGPDGLNLTYSYYNGTWSQPAPVEADGTLDGSFALVANADRACVVWQDAASPVGSNATLESTAPLMGISAAVFDKTSFTSVRLAEGLCTMPDVNCKGGTFRAVWLRNGGNQWFGQAGGNSIVTCDWNNGTWTAPATRQSNLGPVLDMDLSDTFSLAYTLDTDGDLGTSGDREIYRDGRALTANTEMDSGVCFDGNTLYWCSGGRLLREGKPCMGEDALLSTDRFQIVSNHNTRVLVYSAVKGLSNALYAAYASGDAWGDPILLYDGGTSIPSFCPVLSPDGILSVLLHTRSIVGDYQSQDPFGTGRLVWYNAPALAGNLELKDVRFHTSQYVENRAIPFHLTVSNTAQLPVKQVRMQLLDEAGTVLTETVEEVSLLSGTTRELTLLYVPGKITQGQKLTVRIAAEGMAELRTDDNSKQIVMIREDLAVENVSMGILPSGSAAVYGDIINLGYSPRENITVELREGSSGGRVLKIKSIPALEPFESCHVTFTCAPGSGKVYYICVPDRAGNLANNSGYVLDSSQEKKPAFVDVPETAYFYEAVNWAVAEGITYGADDTHFAPDAPCIRKQVVMFLWRAFGKPEPRSMENPFVDVPHNVYEKAILWAYYQGITSGKDAKHFQPEEPCSRKQIVAFLWRAEGKPDPQSMTNPFRDVKPGYFEKPILWAVENGITSGKTAHTFQPEATCTRAQIVAFLYRSSHR